MCGVIYSGIVSCIKPGPGLNKRIGFGSGKRPVISRGAAAAAGRVFQCGIREASERQNLSSG